MQEALPACTRTSKFRLAPAVMALCLLTGLVPALQAQLADEITVRADIRRTVNGRYVGLVYREARIFVQPQTLRSGTLYQYGLEELSRDARSEARLVGARVSGSYDYRYSVSHYDPRFYTEFTDVFGSLYIDPRLDLLVQQNFPTAAPEQLREGLVWRAPAAYLTDPLGSGNATRIPVLVEYRVQGRGLYSGQRVWIVNALYALRYPGSGSMDMHGDRNLTSAQGSHQSTVYYHDSPDNPAQDQTPFFVRTTVTENYRTAQGGTVEQRGFILTWLGDPIYGPSEPVRIADRPNPAQEAEEARFQEERQRQRAEQEERVAQLNSELSQNPATQVEVSLVEDGYKLNLRNLQFVPDQAALLPGEKLRLDSIAAALKEFPENQFLVTGHTAAVGSVESQIELSIERAKAIVAELVARGVDPARVMYEGRGGFSPIGDNATEEGRALNRRVEITIIEP